MQRSKSSTAEHARRVDGLGAKGLVLQCNARWRLGEFQRLNGAELLNSWNSWSNFLRLCRLPRWVISNDSSKLKSGSRYNIESARRIYAASSRKLHQPIYVSAAKTKQPILRPNLSPSLPAVPHSSPLSGFACLDDCFPAFPVKEQDGIGSGDHFVPNSLVNKKPVGEFRNFL